MMDLFRFWHLILFGVLVCLLLMIFYVLSLQKTLNKCHPSSRALHPVILWLSLLPVFNVVCSFIIVLGMTRTLRNEFDLRKIAVADSAPGQTLGITMSVFLCIPGLGFPVYAVLWVFYWVKMNGYSRLLDAPQPVATL